jgi:hypothetical protein
LVDGAERLATDWVREQVVSEEGEVPSRATDWEPTCPLVLLHSMHNAAQRFLLPPPASRGGRQPAPAADSMFVSVEESEALRAWRHSKLVERKGFIMNRFPSRRINRRLIRIAAVVSLVLLTRVATAADFTVTSPGSFFSINGQTNPKLTLIRGKTYTFAVNTACGSHPFKINSLGVTNNNICSGTLTYTVPLTFSNYQYICSIHFFGSTIETIPPPPAPTINIVGLSVGTNVTLLSTGTNTWSLAPEFSTNFSTTNWFALTVQTNRFANGTNETICGRPPGNPLFFRIKAR